MRTFTAQPPVAPPHSFLSQTHQPFFLFGVVWAVTAMVIFTLAHKGIAILSLTENLFHLYAFAFIVFIQFFHGFLFTTFPRFCQSSAIAQKRYIPIVWLYQIFALLFFIGVLSSEWITLIGMSGILVAHAMAFFTLLQTYKTGTSPLKSDPFWMLVSHSIAVAAHAFVILAYGLESLGIAANLFPFITPFIINLFLIFLTFVAAQRMIPFFSHSMEIRSKNFVAQVFILLVSKTVLNLLILPVAEAAVSILLALYLLKEFIRWKLPLFKSPAILWILHLGLFWLPMALFLDGLAQIIETVYAVSSLFLGTHLLLLGFVTTVFIGFGTRVTLGHSGQTPHADMPAKILFWWTQVVLLARLALSFDSALGGIHGWIFDVAALAWIALFGVWGWRYGRILLYGKK